MIFFNFKVYFRCEYIYPGVYFRCKYVFAWKMSKDRVISGPHFPVCGLNTEIYSVICSIWWQNLLELEVSNKREDIEICIEIFLMMPLCFCSIYFCKQFIASNSIGALLQWSEICSSNSDWPLIKITCRFKHFIVSVMLLPISNTLVSFFLLFRSIPPDAFLGKGVQKICGKFSWERVCRMWFQ